MKDVGFHYGMSKRWVDNPLANSVITTHAGVFESAAKCDIFRGSRRWFPQFHKETSDSLDQRNILNHSNIQKMQKKTSKGPNENVNICHSAVAAHVKYA